MCASIGAIILAAGASTRMGEAKQLLLLNEQPLLEHVICRSLAAPFSEIIIVVGFEAQRIQQAISIKDHRIRWVINNDYSFGQSSSLKIGITHFSKKHDGMMIFLGDLPFILNETIQSVFQEGMKMLTEYEESFIVQPSYQGIIGHPVFFGHIDLSLFMNIQGDTGAKAIKKQISCRKQLIVEDKGILFDIDTPEEYEEAKKYWHKKIQA